MVPDRTGGRGSGSRRSRGARAGHLAGAARRGRRQRGRCSEGGDTSDRVVAGMDWLLGLGVRVVSFSLGMHGYNADMLPVVQKLKSSGILIVCPVGNEGPKTSASPGNYAEVLSVGACDEKNRVADFSSSQVLTYPKTRIVPDLVAPGVDILSCIPGGGFSKWSGPRWLHLSSLAWPLCCSRRSHQRAGRRLWMPSWNRASLLRVCPPSAQAEESPTGRVPWRSCCRKSGEKGKPRNSHGGDRLSVSKYLLLLRSPFPTKGRACPENQFQ